jgi:hypothetical protein
MEQISWFAQKLAIEKSSGSAFPPNFLGKTKKTEVDNPRVLGLSCAENVAPRQ